MWAKTYVLRTWFGTNLWIFSRSVCVLNIGMLILGVTVQSLSLSFLRKNGKLSCDFSSHVQKNFTNGEPEVIVAHP